MNRFTRRDFLGASLTAASLAALRPSLFAGEKEGEAEKKIGQTPHTKFAVNIEMWWRRLPFLERIRKTAELGFPAVEFWPWRNKDIPAVAELCQELKIDIAQFTAWGFKPGLNDPQNHDRFVEEIEAGCETAKKLNCKMMTVVGGNDQKGMTQEEMHENIITGLKLAAPIAEKQDVTLILEPMNIKVDHPGHCLYGSAPAIRICNEVGSTHVKINWDLYHMEITEGELIANMKKGFDAKQIGYLQLADHPGRNEPGTGRVDYPKVLKAAHEFGYRDFVGLECRPKEGELTAAKRVAQADQW